MKWETLSHTSMGTTTMGIKCDTTCTNIILTIPPFKSGEQKSSTGEKYNMDDELPKKLNSVSITN